MDMKLTVARYDNAGGFDKLERAVSAQTRTQPDGRYVLASVDDRWDGTATVTVRGPSDLVDELIRWVDANY